MRLTHKPTGEVVSVSGQGKYEHAIEERRMALEELKQKVDEIYIRSFYGSDGT